MDLSELRRNYTYKGLSELDLSPDPLVQFGLWFRQAMDAGVCEPNAMTLATANPDGEPAARTVLLKGYDSGGFRFYTNYESAKGRELAVNPRAALLFYWCELERQIRISGQVEKATQEESDAYFHTRPEGSRLAAWSSAQSQVAPDREMLERNYHEAAKRFATTPMTRPPHWGGYRVRPEMFEFWQGRPSRLHDRLRYRLQEGVWRIDRLSP